MQSNARTLMLVVATIGAPIGPSAVATRHTPLTLTLSPSTIVGGNVATGTITLVSAAGNGGAIVTITNPPGTTVDAGSHLAPGGSDGSTRISIPGGQTSVTFRLLTTGVAAPVTAAVAAKSGGDAATSALTIIPASVRSVVVAPASVVGGRGATATISLDGAAAAGAVIHVLAVSTASNLKQLGLADGSTPVVSTQPASVPGTVQLPAGATSATVAVSTNPVSIDQTVAIQANLGTSSASGSFRVAAPAVVSLQLSPTSVVGGTSSTGTISLNGAAPLSGVSVALTSSSTIVRVPASVTIPSGSTHITFQVSTTAPPVPSLTVKLTASKGLLTTTTTTSTISDGTSNTVQVGETTGSVSAILTVVLRSP